ncbi:MAG: hypothetical protein NZL92_11760, partial [Gloeomargarita sp. SKYG116]|nr:hypothetical protein [Gloeomargarita sp. SKYG116]MDW8402357.1 type III-B CRISPR module-associated Cmr3 family protein [Gloeomargarita sp. SKYGB_i_bin116]
LYFPRPLHIFQGEFLMPVSWLPESDGYHRCYWDETRPAPLVSSATKGSTKEKGAAYFPYAEILKLWDTQKGMPAEGVEEPWDVEIRPHNTIQEAGRRVKETDGYFVETCVRLKPGWSLAVSLETYDESTQEGQPLLIKEPVPLRLGGEGHYVVMKACSELQKQWHELEQRSQEIQKFQKRCLDYLITPGVFIKMRDGVSLCRAWPWEWHLAHPRPNTPQVGPLVSVATDKPIPINGRIRARDEKDEEFSLPAPQVFAAPPGSVYFLERPARLAQDEPVNTHKGTPNPYHRWRLLGYSEMLWLPSFC